MNIYVVGYHDADFVRLNPRYKIGWVVKRVTKVGHAYVEEELVISPDGIKVYGHFYPSKASIFKGERKVIKEIFR